MAPWLFTEAILKGQPLRLFNRGEMRRDFTFVDDIVRGSLQVLLDDGVSLPQAGARSRLFNIGGHQPVPLMDFVGRLEQLLGRKARLELLPMQPGDVKETFADIEPIAREHGFAPATSLDDGLQAWVDWYLRYTGQARDIGTAI